MIASHIDDLTSQTNSQNRIAYCPERTAETVALEEIVTLPQIIATFTEEAFEKALKLFGPLCDAIRLTPEEAEYAKLITNIWRYSEFALANHFY